MTTKGLRMASDAFTRNYGAVCDQLRGSHLDLAGANELADAFGQQRRPYRPQHSNQALQHLAGTPIAAIVLRFSRP